MNKLIFLIVGITCSLLIGLLIICVNLYIAKCLTLLNNNWGMIIY